MLFATLFVAAGVTLGGPVEILLTPTQVSKLFEDACASDSHFCGRKVRSVHHATRQVVQGYIYAVDVSTDDQRVQAKLWTRDSITTVMTYEATPLTPSHES